MERNRNLTIISLEQIVLVVVFFLPSYRGKLAKFMWSLHFNLPQQTVESALSPCVFNQGCQT